MAKRCRDEKNVGTCVWWYVLSDSYCSTVNKLLLDMSELVAVRNVSSRALSSKFLSKISVEVPLKKSV